MAKTFSFDVVSRFDEGEMNNVVDQARREINNRYDFKGTSASVEFADAEKNSLKITGDNQYQLDAIIDIVRKKAATRDVSQKTFDVKANEPTEANLSMKWLVPLVSGLDQQKTKEISKRIRNAFPKLKPQIQGDEVRVSGNNKDDLQASMNYLKEADLDFPITFTNFK